MPDVPKASLPRAAAAVAVACPGPSLAATAPEAQQADVVIAVNRACCAAAADFWVALDAYTYDWVAEAGGPLLRNACRPAIVCSAAALRRIAAKHDLPAAFLDRAGLPAGDFKAIRWSRYSWATAMILAGAIRPQRIDCYGMDWSGGADYDGFTHKRQRRTDSRWNEERDMFARIADILTARGTAVMRHLPEQLSTAEDAQIAENNVRS